jgi:hypothetical protein
MEKDLLKKRLMARDVFVEFKNFRINKENVNSSKRIRLSTIDEYFLDENGVLVVYNSGKKNTFRFRSESKAMLTIEKLDSLFSIERI